MNKGTLLKRLSDEAERYARSVQEASPERKPLPLPTYDGLLALVWYGLDYDLPEDVTISLLHSAMQKARAENAKRTTQHFSIAAVDAYATDSTPWRYGHDRPKIQPLLSALRHGPKTRNELEVLANDRGTSHPAVLELSYWDLAVEDKSSGVFTLTHHGETARRSK